MNSILARIASSGCASVRSRLAEYLDGRLTGREMQRIAKHLEGCGKCAAEFEAEQHLLRALSSLGAVSGPSRQPDDLLLRIRVAISQERAQRRRSRLDDWRLAWHNSIGPFLLKASTGFASAVLLLGTVSVLVGMFAHPEPASAQDEPLGMATAPKFLYQSGAIPDVENIGTTEDGPIVVEAYVNGQGRVYDYRIVSGPTDPQTRSQVVNLLLFSVFEPARFFGQPVRGLAVLSFSGVSVHS